MSINVPSPDGLDLSGLNPAEGLGLSVLVAAYVLELEVLQRSRVRADGLTGEFFDYWDGVRGGWLPVKGYSTDNVVVLKQVVPSLTARGWRLVLHTDGSAANWWARVENRHGTVRLGSGYGDLAQAVSLAAVEAVTGRQAAALGRDHGA